MDPNGNAIAYSLDLLGVTGHLPTGTLKADGTMIFSPAPGDVGTYQFGVVAGNDTGRVEQVVTLTVLADPVTTTRVSGVVQDTDERPLAGIPVKVGSVQVVTGSDGSFLLDLGAGMPATKTLEIHGEQAGGGKTYAQISMTITNFLGHALYAGVNNHDCAADPLGGPGHVPCGDDQSEPGHDGH